MIKVTVPATSANLGPGFDSLGVALNLYNNIYLEEYDSVDISSCDGSFVPLGEKNIIYKIRNSFWCNSDIMWSIFQYLSYAIYAK